MPPDNQQPQAPPPMPPPSGNPASPGPLNQPQPWRPTAPPAQAPPSSAKQEVVERLKQANNVLVTVSNNPSVDQLAACIGLTLMLNKMGKHATAVFSGTVPSTIEFLQPEKTIEKNTNSLRDFIIALDKAKADKLRYKIEDKYVKIFITPYRTSLSEKDLEFSQGDFNVEVVLALGVGKKEELDQAITAHGRILHDATVVSVNNQETGQIGAINWHESGASSLSELLVSLGESLQPGIIDAQMATAFLTGIVAETERFSNNKTSAVTMGIASQLMKSGANQQLIATKLEEPPPPPPPPPSRPPKKSPKKDDKPEGESKKPMPLPPPAPKKDDGSLQIPHDDKPATPPPPDLSGIDGEDVSLPGEADNSVDRIRIDEQGELHKADEVSANVNEPPASPPEPPQMVLHPPSHGGTLTANTKPEAVQPNADPLSLPSVSPPDNSLPSVPANMPTSDFGSNTPDSRLFGATPPSLNNARQGVTSAQSAQDEPLRPIAGLNAQPIDLGKNGPPSNAAQNPPSAPPPVPPPMMPPNLSPPTDQNGSQQPPAVL